MRHYSILVLSIVLLVGVSTVLSHGDVYNSTEPLHNCVHDNMRDKISSIIAPQTYATGQHTRDVEGRKSMRITVDTSLLSSDQGAACYSVGEYAKIGKPPGASPTPTCGGSRTDDCWKKCEEADVLTPEKASFITDRLIPNAVAYLQKVLKTNRMTESLVIPKAEGKSAVGTCAEHINIPESYSTDGIANTDLALIVTARPTTEHTIAWAIECASDQTGRPVFGLINVGPTALKNMDNMIDYYFRVVVHEMTHVLGFNSGKFNMYSDPATSLKYKRVTIQSTTAQGVTVDKIVTPKALAAAREHFGCASLDGVLLEDGGGHSTSKSHWEKRVFRNEYMTGTADQHSVFSKITLAFLEDILMGSCKDWHSYGYFCDEIDAKSCTSNRNSIGYCNLAKKSRIPAGFRYFSNQNLGGNDELADFCPYIQAYTNGLCTDVHNKPSHADILGSEYGPNSKCFESSLAMIGYTTKEATQPLCYNYRCTAGHLEVQIGGDWYGCPFDGVVENVAGFNGILKCPDRTFCTAHGANVVSHSPSMSNNNNNGDQSNKKSDFGFNYDMFFTFTGDGADGGPPADNGFNFFGSGAEQVTMSHLSVVVLLLIALYLF